MPQLCHGGPTIILSVNLALTIVFRYDKSGIYVNTYLDGWW